MRSMRHYLVVKNIRLFKEKTSKKWKKRRCCEITIDCWAATTGGTKYCKTFTAHVEATNITSPWGCCWAGWPSPPSTLGRGRCYKPRPPVLSGWEWPSQWPCFLYLGLPQQQQESPLFCDGLEQELRREVHSNSSTFCLSSLQRAQWVTVLSSFNFWCYSPRNLKIKANWPCGTTRYYVVMLTSVNADQCFFSNTTYNHSLLH